MKRAKERDSSETAAIKINRRKVCLLIIAIGICVLLLITMLGLLHLEKSNTRRYREENHARFDVNTQAFQEVLDSSDAWIGNIKKLQSMRYPIWKRPVRQIFWPI